MPMGTSFIKFDLSTRTMLTAPPTLTITNVQFKNFLYEFNSFIELGDYGGFVTITDSTFTNMNTCGAVLRNRRYNYNRIMTRTTY